MDSLLRAAIVQNFRIHTDRLAFAVRIPNAAPFLAALFLFPGFLDLVPACAEEGDFSSQSEEVQSQLLEGNVVLLERRPDESTEVDKRFVTMAKLMSVPRAVIWEVINDKEDAEKFLKGVLESRVISTDENEIVAAQKTHVGGPKGAYRYTLRHKLTPMEKAEFTFVEGEIRNVIGAWWIFEGPDEDRMLVTYSLHIDPGVFAPQFVVKRGMKKTIPETLKSIEKESLRRQALIDDASR